MRNYENLKDQRDTETATATSVTNAVNNDGELTATAALADLLFAEPTGESEGELSGDSSVGGAGGEAAVGEGPSAGDGVGAVTGAGAGAGEVAFPNSSGGRRTLSTENITTGVASSTVSASLDGAMPVWRTTSSPEVDVVISYFPAPLVAKVEILFLLVFKEPLGLYSARA